MTIGYFLIAFLCFYLTVHYAQAYLVRRATIVALQALYLALEMGNYRNLYGSRRVYRIRGLEIVFGIVFKLTGQSIIFTALIKNINKKEV